MSKKKEKILTPLKNGFTLAEVLITLGIIGVVAAMTIPTLVANYQAKSWSTSASVFERKLEEALKVMNTQQTLAGYTTTEAFVDEFKKHIKILKTCDNTNLDECFPKEFLWGSPEPETKQISTFIDSSKLRLIPYETNTVGIQFANGVSAVVAYDPECRQDPYSNTITGMSCISMLYDTSGFKSPNQSGKDLRALNVNKLWTFKIGNTKYTAPFTPEPYVWNSCTRTGTSENPTDIAQMEKYNFKYCLTPSFNRTQDYWGGAVMACGGTDKLPSRAQVAEIANYVYNTDKITSSGTVNGIKLDIAKATSLGFKVSSFNSFTLWSGEEDGSASVYGVFSKSFGSNSAMEVIYNRDKNSIQAVCLGD